MSFIDGTGGPDELDGTDAEDQIFGFGGDDTIFASKGDDGIYGGAGRDTVDYGQSTDAVSVIETGSRPEVSSPWTGTDTLDSIEIVIGSRFDDWLSAIEGINTVYGGLGNDELRNGFDGRSSLYGGSGDDTYHVSLRNSVTEIFDSGTGNRLEISPNDLTTLVFRDNSYVFSSELGGRAIVHLDGQGRFPMQNVYLGLEGFFEIAQDITDLPKSSALVPLTNGKDVLDFSDAGNAAATYMVFANGGNDRLTLSDVARFTVRAGGGDDVVRGGRVADTISGELGDDRLLGGTGRDSLFGGDGDDVLYGQGGNDLLGADRGADTFFGGFGHDVVSYRDDNGAVSNIDLLDPTRNTGFARGDSYDGIEVIYGSGYGGSVAGSEGADELHGYFGGSTLIGRGGADVLVAHFHATKMEGGAGADEMYGDSGLDYADTFLYRAAGDSGTDAQTWDVIHNFSAADKIDLSRIDAREGINGNQAFDFLTSPPTTGRAGVVWLQEGRDGTLVVGDIDGDGQADFIIRVAGRNIEIEADDLVL